MNNIVSALMLLMSLGIILGYAKPTYQKETGALNFPDKSIKELKSDIEKYSQAFDRMREVEDIKGGLQTKYNSISEQDREKLMKSLPKEVDVIRLIVDLTERSSAYGMSLKSISINKSNSSISYSRPGEIQNLNSAPKYPFVDLSFEVSGSYDNLVSFFGDLEKSLRFIELVSVGISSASTVSTSGSSGSVQPATSKPNLLNGYSAKVTLRSYSLPDIIQEPINQNNGQPGI